jgi:hypothetical protein
LYFIPFFLLLISIFHEDCVNYLNSCPDQPAVDFNYGGYGSYGSFSAKANSNQEINCAKRHSKKKAKQRKHDRSEKQQQPHSNVSSSGDPLLSPQSDLPVPVANLEPVEPQPAETLASHSSADQQQAQPIEISGNTDELYEVDLLHSFPSVKPVESESAVANENPIELANVPAREDESQLNPSPCQSSSASSRCSSATSSSSESEDEDEQQDYSQRQMSFRKYTESVNLKMLKLSDEIRNMKYLNEQQALDHQAQQQKLQLQIIDSSNTIMRLESLKMKEKQAREELEAKLGQLTSQMTETNEEFSSYRRRAQVLIEQNQTSYKVDGGEVLSPIEEKGLFVEKLKELEVEISTLQALLQHEKLASKNMLSLLEHKNEKLNEKLSKAVAEIELLGNESKMNKIAAETSFEQLKVTHEKQLLLEAKKHHESFSQLEEKLNSLRHNSLNQLGERDEKIARLRDTVDMKTEEILKIEKERDKVRDDIERLKTFPQFNSKIVVPVSHGDASKNDTKSKENLAKDDRSEDTFLSFVGSQAKKEKELVQSQEMLEHYKALLSETEAQNNLLMLQLEALKLGKLLYVISSFILFILHSPYLSLFFLLLVVSSVL